MKIEVKVQDYISREYTAIYVPSPKPLTTLMRHPLEKGGFVKADKNATLTVLLENKSEV